jgi:hypothetical protein
VKQSNEPAASTKVGLRGRTKSKNKERKEKIKCGEIRTERRTRLFQGGKVKIFFNSICPSFNYFFPCFHYLFPSFRFFIEKMVDMRKARWQGEARRPW